MGEWEVWLKAGTGDDKTDIVVIADFWERTGGLFSRDRDISGNTFFIPFGGLDARSGNFPGRVGGFRLLPKMFFGPGGVPMPGVNTPVPHSSMGVGNSPFYVNPFVINPNAYPGAPGVIGPNAMFFFPQSGTQYKGGGDYFFYNFAAVTPALPPADRQSFYGSFIRDICGKNLQMFSDFKVVRSFFDSSLAAVPFLPDPFKTSNGTVLSPAGISVPIRNAWNPFTVGNATWIGPGGEEIPVTTGVRFRGINDTGQRSEKFTYYDYLFDVGLRGQMGEFGDYFKTWNWEMGFRYSRNEGQDLSIGEVSQPGLRQALLDTNPASAFDPFLNYTAHNGKLARSQVYVNLHRTGEFEMPFGYLTVNGDLFNLPAGPVSFAVGGEYTGQRQALHPDPLNTTFNTIGSVDGQGFEVNRDFWSIYEEVRVPFTSPTWNFSGFYSLEVDFAEREEWYSNNTSQVLPVGPQAFQPSAHSRYNAQKPKVSVRWQPTDPKYIGALTLRGSYTEAFHAPALSNLSPASSQNFPGVLDPFTLTNPAGFRTELQVEERLLGNPNLHPEVAYEYTFGFVYGPKWFKGMTLSLDWWHIDMRNLVTSLGAQFIIENSTRPPFSDLVVRGAPPPGGAYGPVLLVTDPNVNLAGAIFEGYDFEGVYILDPTIFGHGDYGKLTLTINGTYLARAEFQPTTDTKRFGIAGEFLPTSFALTNSLPRWRFNASIYYDGPADTWLGGLDIGAVVHFVSDLNDDNIDLTRSPKPQMPITGGPNNPSFFPYRARNINSWVTLDLILNYTFNFPPPAPAEVPGLAKDGGKNVVTKDNREKQVMSVSTADYGCATWKWWLNNTTITLGMQNVTDEAPPFGAVASGNGYDESLATIKGRFWYVQVKRRF
jgi:hypothetical protein